MYAISSDVRAPGVVVYDSGLFVCLSLCRISLSCTALSNYLPQSSEVGVALRRLATSWSADGFI